MNSPAAFVAGFLCVIMLMGVMDMPSDIGKTIMIFGLLLVVVGAVIHFGGRILPLGHLPGDIFIGGEHGSFYFPVVSCIVISIVLSVLANIFMR